jgi:hypothetical protein
MASIVQHIDSIVGVGYIQHIVSILPLGCIFSMARLKRRALLTLARILIFSEGPWSHDIGRKIKRAYKPF